MRRILSLLLAGLMALGLCACGKNTTENPSDAEAQYLCSTLNYGRLYAFCMDGGEKTLVADKQAYCYDRRGNELVAAFVDGTICSFDLSTGKSETILTVDMPVGEVHRCKSGLVFSGYTTYYEQKYYFYDFRSEKLTELADLENKYLAESIGDVLYFFGFDDGRFFYSYDVSSGAILWKIDGSDIYRTRAQNGELYIEESGEDRTVWYRVNPENAEREELEIPFDPAVYSLEFFVNGGCIVNGGAEDNFKLYYADASGIKPIEFDTLDSDYWSIADHDGDTLLLSGSQVESYGEEIWYDVERFCFLSAEDGTCVALDRLDENQKMFLDGNFPQLDSSTARKPVTNDLYKLFCLSAGVDGVEPLCSTTHNAWLNIADGTVDLALLAAPTQEEQDYLKSKNVTVDMKLYGGDGLVFIGSKACGVETLTTEELRAIFRGDITNWAQLGGVNHEIRVLYRDDQSGSQRLFERLLFKGQEVPDLQALGFEELDEMSTIVYACMDDPYAIGYSIMTYLSDVYEHSELLSFAVDGYEATPENVRSGNYPLGTQGYVVIRSDQDEDSPARRLYQWFNSPICDDILRSNGVVPLHE